MLTSWKGVVQSDAFFNPQKEGASHNGRALYFIPRAGRNEMEGKKINRRADHEGPHRTVFEKNKKRILATETVCAICGRPVNKSLPKGDPMAPEIDHIIPISKNGHPSDISNLCLVHASCNKAKSDKVFLEDKTKKPTTNQNLPWSLDWFTVGK